MGNDAIVDRTIVITGASSGIGEAAARRLASEGAQVCLLARRADELERIVDSIRAAGGKATAYPVDLTNRDALAACAAALLRDQPRIDVLVNNAGRSIRRHLRDSLDRAHDFERTMQLNFNAAVNMTLSLLGRMLDQGSGHVINVSSVAALMSPPRFAAYIASKAALDAFSKSMRVELSEDGIAVTTLNYPLVRTPMTEPTAIYRFLPQMDVTEAAEWIVDAVLRRPARRTTRLALAFHVATSAVPGPALDLLASYYRRRVEKLRRRLESEASAADA